MTTIECPHCGADIDLIEAIIALTSDTRPDDEMLMQLRELLAAFG